MRELWRSGMRKRLAYRLRVRKQLRVNFHQAIPFWIASLLTGIVAVIYTKLFSWSENFLQSILHWHSWFIFILTPVSFCISWWLVKIFAPHAGGSGIPQVMAAIDLTRPKHEQSVSGLLNVKVIVIKILSSLFMVFGGGAIGREGPTIQIAGSIFRLVNKLTPASWSKLSERSFIITGAAAGLAAAFNTPLGGIVFAIEELARVHISFFRTALFSAVIISGLAAKALLGPYLYLGYPDVENLKTSIFLGVFVSAIIAGLFGGIMCKLILKIMHWKMRFNNFKSFLFIVVAGLVIAAVAFFLNGEIVGSGKEIMNQTLFTANKQVPWHTVLFRILGPVLSFNIGGAGGIFAPSLAAGASVGAYFSELFGVTGADANILILSGMVGFLTGVTRTPFTSAILVLEMTDRHSIIFHLMLAALVSNIAALLVDKHSLYEQLKKNYILQAKNEENIRAATHAKLVQEESGS